MTAEEKLKQIIEFLKREEEDVSGCLTKEEIDNERFDRKSFNYRLGCHHELDFICDRIEEIIDND